MHWFVHIIRYALLRWGYLALGVGLFAEDAGLPVPGEATLMFSSFLSHQARGLELGCVIVVGIAAATLGDNLGFLAGRWLGPRLLRWLKRKFSMEEDIAVAKDQIEKHGKATVFWARYIFGLRLRATSSPEPSILSRAISKKADGPCPSAFSWPDTPSGAAGKSATASVWLRNSSQFVALNPSARGRIRSRYQV